MRCQSCGAEAPLKQVSFHQNVGLLVVRFHSHVTGQLCRRCIDREFWQRTLITLFFGPWGIISLIFTPIILIGNVTQYLGALSLPHGGPPDPMMSSGAMMPASGVAPTAALPAADPSSAATPMGAPIPVASPYGHNPTSVGASQFSGRSKWIALGVLGVSMLGCCGSCFGMVGFSQWLQSRVAPLAVACDGSGVAASAALVPGTVPSIAVMEHQGASWTGQFNVLETSLSPADTTEEAALVLCMEAPETVEIERCDYTNGSTIVRNRIYRRARLVEARTGRVLSDQTVAGPDPALCGEWSQAGGFQTWSGTDPSEDQPTWTRAFGAAIPH